MRHLTKPIYSAFVAFLFSLPSFAAVPVATQDVAVKVTIAGFVPSSLHVKKNTPTRLLVTRTTDITCATEVVIPQLKIHKDLPLNQQVEIDLGTLKTGEIRFGCGMDLMLNGVIFIK